MEPKDVRLQGLFQTYGKTIILPYDQGLEHGPRDFFNARYAEDPLHIIEIAKKGVQCRRSPYREREALFQGHV
jgi:DhnA family fructose-bisphosphate aldolase class Ia